MNEPLRPEVLHTLPPRRYLIGSALGGALLGAASVLAVVAARGPAVCVIALTPASAMPIEAPAVMAMAPASAMPIEAPVACETVASPPTEAQPAPSHDLLFAFVAGETSYLRIVDVSDPARANQDARPRAIAMPAHGPVRMTREEGGAHATAAVKAHDVPARLRGWLGQTVVLDDGCRAVISQLEVVARLEGEPFYADGVDADEWTADAVLSLGSPVLAARLDGCTGAFARAATAPAVAVLRPAASPDAAQVDGARAALIASSASMSMQAEWRETFPATAWHDDAVFSVQVATHPITGVTWISAHATTDSGCGEPYVSVWGLYRVDQGGALVAVQERRFEDVHAIESLLDVDADGVPELLARPWRSGDVGLVRADGSLLDRLGLPFFGCRC